MCSSDLSSRIWPLSTLTSASGRRPSTRAAPAPSTEAAATVETGAAAQVEKSSALDAGQAAPVDVERVKVIRHAIETGTYPVVPAKIADAMIAAGMLLRTAQ